MKITDKSVVWGRCDPSLWSGHPMTTAIGKQLVKLVKKMRNPRLSDAARRKAAKTIVELTRKP